MHFRPVREVRFFLLFPAGKPLQPPENLYSRLNNAHLPHFPFSFRSDWSESGVRSSSSWSSDSVVLFDLFFENVVTLLLVEGLILTVRGHNYDLSLFFWILDFVRGSVLSFLLRLFVVRRSDHRRKRIRNDFAMRWYYFVSLFFLCWSFLVASRYCYSHLFKLIILYHYVRRDLVHCFVLPQF